MTRIVQIYIMTWHLRGVVMLKLKFCLISIFLFFACAQTHAADKLRPYVLAYESDQPVESLLSDLEEKMEPAGFALAGGYSPYEGAHVLAFTNEGLLAAAAESEFGGFGAVIRVSLTEVEGKVQVAYVNPLWMQNVYRMEGDLTGLAETLATTLGAEKEFGSEEGKKVKKLRKYHYMMMMPYFDDMDELAAYNSHDQAVKTLENNLQQGIAGTAKVYKVALPGKEEVLFGVAISEGKGADETVMSATDKEALKHTAHLPYEILVSGNRAYALAGKFRIAQSFPDLSMGTFMKISSAPKAIKETLEAVARPE